MPLTYSVYPVLKLLRIFATERPTIEDWIAMLECIATDSEVRPGYDLVVDRTRTPGAPAACDVRLWAARHGEAARGRGFGRVAFVVASDDVLESMRMASRYAAQEDFALEVFTSDADALRWLGHPVAGEGNFDVRATRAAGSSSP